MKQKIHELGCGWYVLETRADGDRIVEMFNEKNEIRFSLQCSEEGFEEAWKKAIKISEAVSINEN